MGTRINSGPRSSGRIKLIENRTTALRLRMSGMSLQAIADSMGISKTRARQYIDDSISERTAKFTEAQEEVRQLELARIDALWQKHFPRAPADIQSAGICIKLMERRAAYLGLDAPHETRLANAPQLPDPLPAYDLSKLDPTELQQFRALLAKAAS